MPRLTRRVSLLVAFSVFAAVATAGAECAWVLWEETVTMSNRGDTRGWEIVGAALDAKGCNAFGALAATDRAERWRGPLTNVKVEGNQVTVVSQAGFVSNFRFLCHPDTVDPRAQKGK